MPLLILYRKDQEILRYPLNGSLVRIGRHPSNELTLPDTEISRFHAEIEPKDGAYWVRDRSRNGTLVNGRRIEGASLSIGDRVALGPWTLVFAEEAGWEDRETAVRRTGRSGAAPSFQGIIGLSEGMGRVFEKIGRVAPTAATVLVLGETGTGKELVTRAIHDLSARSRKPFVAINCGAISHQLIESELFGHERGAFTGAVGRHLGAFEQAQGGTIFLDEVGELPIELQPKLLRVLEERRFRRVGGNQEIEVDIRIVAATHRRLEASVKQGRFREDLYFRLCAIPITLPPLRERKEDIALLARYFLETLQSRDGSEDWSPKSWSNDALDRLQEHPWPGNVRELRNVVTRSLLFAVGDLIRAEDVLFYAEEMPAEKPFLINVERQAIVNALREHGWNKTRAAKHLGIARSTIFEKIVELGIKKE